MKLYTSLFLLSLLIAPLSFPSITSLLSQSISTLFQNLFHRNPSATSTQCHEHVTRNGSELLLCGKRWTASGANVYWLGLDENVPPTPSQPYHAPLHASYPTKARVVEIMQILQSMGATTIRSHTLGISVGNPLSLMPTLGEWNEEAFEAIDWAVYQAGLYGLRLIVPLTDNWDYYHGGKFSFLRFRGVDIPAGNSVGEEVMRFYDDERIKGDFRWYVERWLERVNGFSGVAYKDDPTVWAVETGNELGGREWGDRDVPVGWTREIARLVKEVAPKKMVIDGTFGINPSHLDIEEIDIFSNHFYPLDVEQLKEDIRQVGAVNKVYLASEYDWTAPKAGAVDHMQEFFDIIEAAQQSSQPVIAGDHFWSLFGRNPPDEGFVEHDDGFTMHYGNPANSKEVDERIASIRRHLLRMRT